MHVPLDERVERWLDQSKRDRAAALTLQSTQPHLACFHAQQAVAKALKAFLTRVVGDAPPTHLSGELLEALAACVIAVRNDVRVEALESDKYYLPTRYPDALGFADAALAFGSRSAGAAIEAATSVDAWVTAELETLGSAADPGTPEGPTAGDP